jgi:hypothetical protein
MAIFSEFLNYYNILSPGRIQVRHSFRGQCEKDYEYPILMQRTEVERLCESRDGGVFATNLYIRDININNS